MVVGIIFLCMAVIILLGTYYAYRYAFYFRDNRTDEERLEIPSGEQYQKEKEFMMTLMQEMAQIPYEQVYITSIDGLKLAGRYYHISDDAPLQIQMHGYKSDGIRDFCGGNKAARKMGMNTLMIDQRAHGKSEGHTITFGEMERLDCLQWLKYANERFGSEKEIILAGLSMGAATVLMASELDLPDNVKGIIADCPYSSPKAIICKVGEYLKLPSKLVYPFIVLGAKWFGGFHLSASSPVEAVKHAKVPILLIHGEDDRFVPCEMGREVYKANPKMITLETFPDAGHGISYILDCERYERVVKEFVNRCLSNV